MAQALIALTAGVGGVVLGAFLSRRNEKRAAVDRLLVEALNDLVAGVADSANGVKGADARCASAIARLGLHGSPEIVVALQRFREHDTTCTADGRAALIHVFTTARRELGQRRIDDAQLAVLLFTEGR